MGERKNPPNVAYLLFSDVFFPSLFLFFKVLRGAALFL